MFHVKHRVPEGRDSPRNTFLGTDPGPRKVSRDPGRRSGTPMFHVKHRPRGGRRGGGPVLGPGTPWATGVPGQDRESPQFRAVASVHGRRIEWRPGGGSRARARSSWTTRLGLSSSVPTRPTGLASRPGDGARDGPRPSQGLRTGLRLRERQRFLGSTPVRVGAVGQVPGSPQALCGSPARGPARQLLAGVAWEHRPGPGAQLRSRVRGPLSEGWSHRSFGPTEGGRGVPGRRPHRRTRPSAGSGEGLLLGSAQSSDA